MAQRGTRALSVVARLKPGVELATAAADIQALARALEQSPPGLERRVERGRDAAPSGHRRERSNTAAPALCVYRRAPAHRLRESRDADAGAERGATQRNRRPRGPRRRPAADRSSTRDREPDHGRRWRNCRTADRVRRHAGFSQTWVRRTFRAAARSASTGSCPAFALVAALLAGLAFAAIPALEVSRADLSGSLKAEAAARLWRTPGIKLRDLLVAGQVALALLLLVGAGLLVRSILRLQAVELGFLPERVATATVSLPGSKYPSGPQRLAFFDDVVRRIEGVPGVRAAGLVSHLPLAGAGLSADVVVDGARPMSSGEVPAVELRNANTGYFRAMGIRVLGGREFADTDKAGGSPVVIVDATFASRFLPNRDPVGTRVRLGATIGADSAWREIVGVVSGIRSAGVEVAPAPTVYVPYAQNPWPTMFLVVRADSEPEAVSGSLRHEVRALDRDLPALQRALARTGPGPCARVPALPDDPAEWICRSRGAAGRYRRLRRAGVRGQRAHA